MKTTFFTPDSTRGGLRLVGFFVAVATNVQALKGAFLTAGIAFAALHPVMSFNILAIAQAGRLEHEAILLAASLRHADPGFSGTLFIAEPQPGPKWREDPRISDRTRKMLTGLGATILPFETRVFGSDYPLITPDRWMKDFDEAGFRDEVKPLILKSNAMRLLKLG